MVIKGLRFVRVRTHNTNSEQYDVYDRNGNYVANVRLKHGGLRCDHNGELIYTHGFHNVWMCNFENELQRYKYLDIIAYEINEYYRCA